MNRTWLIPLLAFTVLIAALLASPPAVGAQERIPTDDEVNDVAKKLYCPVCPNTPLDVCETKACQDWRAEIRAQLSSGWSEAQVMDYFMQRYGERVLAEPEREGFSSLLWVLPYVAVAMGLIVVFVALHSWRRSQPEAMSAGGSGTLADNVTPQARARIERELQELL